MVEVEVHNFQSIEQATFRIDGFTVVVGRSNIGKSSLVRALKAALTGAPASSVVRHSPTCLRKLKQAKTCKCYSAVHIKATDFDLLWEKGDAVNRYTFNGQVYDKAERGTPEFLQPQFSPIKVGDRQELLQVSDQFNPIFLLDQTGGAVADTLSDVARLDCINAAIRLAEKDRKEAASTRKVRDKDILSLNLRLESYAGLDDVLAEVQRVSEQQVQLEAKEKAIQKVDLLLERTSALASSVRELMKVVAIEAPDPPPLRDASQKLGELQAFLQHQTERDAGVTLLQGVDDVIVPSPQPLQQQAEMLARLTSWVDLGKELKVWATSWKTVQDLPSLHVDPLKSSFDEFQRVGGFRIRAVKLTDDIEDLDQALQNVFKEEAAITVEQEILGVCPTCTRSLADCLG